MSDQWYLSKDGQQQGPVTYAQLQQMAVAGRLQPMDLVWRHGQWIEARQVQGLTFSPPLAAPSPVPPPVVSVPAHASQPTTDLTGKARSLAGALASRGKAAAQLVAKQAERTKLVSVNLPGAYQALGKHLHDTGRLRTHVPEHYQAVDTLLAEIQTIRTRVARQPQAEGIAAKAKAAAKSAADMAQTKALQVRLNHACGELGKAAFDRLGNQAGPAELIHPITDLRSRMASLDAEIAELSKAAPGQIVTPKRIAVVGAVSLVLLFLAVGWHFAGGTGKLTAMADARNVSQREKPTGGFDFSKFDYSKGPNGEQLHTEWEQGDSVILQALGFTDAEGHFLQHGKNINWYERPTDTRPGLKCSELYYYAHQRHGPMVSYYRNGRKWLQGTYQNGKKVGQWLNWYEDGALHFDEYFVDGQYEGTSYEYYPTGKPKTEDNWHEGERHGRVQRWDESGTRIIDTQYANGTPRPMYDVSKFTEREFTAKIKAVMTGRSTLNGSIQVIGGMQVVWEEAFGEPDEEIKPKAGIEYKFVYRCTDGPVRLRMNVAKRNGITYWMLVPPESNGSASGVAGGSTSKAYQEGFQIGLDMVRDRRSKLANISHPAGSAGMKESLHEELRTHEREVEELANNPAYGPDSAAYQRRKGIYDALRKGYVEMGIEQ